MSPSLSWIRIQGLKEPTKIIAKVFYFDSYIYQFLRNLKEYIKKTINIL